MGTWRKTENMSKYSGQKVHVSQHLWVWLRERSLLLGKHTVTSVFSGKERETEREIKLQVRDPSAQHLNNPLLLPFGRNIPRVPNWCSFKNQKQYTEESKSHTGPAVLGTEETSS